MFSLIFKLSSDDPEIFFNKINVTLATSPNGGTIKTTSTISTCIDNIFIKTETNIIQRVSTRNLFLSDNSAQLVVAVCSSKDPERSGESTVKYGLINENNTHMFKKYNKYNLVTTNQETCSGTTLFIPSKF
jgi:hypothetical protein